MNRARTKPSVLLVDDVEANLVALEALLADLDCETVRATSGNEALRQLLRGNYALILLDVQMPGMDGLEVAQLTRSNPATRDIPIIFVTAMSGTEENLLNAYGTGAVDFLPKPINPSILRSKVRVFLDLYASRSALAGEVEAHKETMAELEAFNYSVSHDLRAPLRPIDGFSAALLEDYGDVLDAEAKQYLTRIRDAARRMSDLIDDLLGLSRINIAPLDERPVDLSALARLIVDEIVRSDAERKVDISIEDGMRVVGDARLLRIAMENLLRNAWKFTSKSPNAKIEVGCRASPGPVSYFVRDNGAGFDPAHAAKLFRPFQRLHTTAQFEGTGIGLAIVARIFRRHGGRVWAESQPGRGATFLFSMG